MNKSSKIKLKSEKVKPFFENKRKSVESNKTSLNKHSNESFGRQSSKNSLVDQNSPSKNN